MTELLNIKYEHETVNYNTILPGWKSGCSSCSSTPPRSKTPAAEEKGALNQRAADIYFSPAFIQAVNRPPHGSHVPADCFTEAGIESARRELDATKLRRLVQASVQYQFLTPGAPLPTSEDGTLFLKNRSAAMGGISSKITCSPPEDLLGYWVPRRILYISDQAGR